MKYIIDVKENENLENIIHREIKSGASLIEVQIHFDGKHLVFVKPEKRSIIDRILGR